ncbi:hypothetical protein BN59_02525 [Legionella massiliensis]|uniref:Uncharacterized protein n=1 Tax=Legionella massiliensis TaxID=1034943 RepID=A0A078KYS4_9GAMM|nr:hypothetical protein [Legionella massiliensis]CDZ78217.1 hypothetical protein BN59_02525 [Legionella massiliensis]CEE13955.1 hypothetical protein BN1094_02525 [Legionella massiliensis]
MKRIVVYGNASKEKEKFVNDLQVSSQGDFSFQSSTHNSRFNAIDNGIAAPVHTAPWQLLVVPQHDAHLETATNFETTYFQCDFARPLVVVFYGKENEKTAPFIEACQSYLAGQPNVVVLSAEKLEDLKASKILGEFTNLENLPQPSPNDPSMGL